jgi:RNA polymerase sigma factor (sigma-70 family)
MAERAEDAMAMLSRRFRPALMAFFVRRIRNPIEAEDLTQDVLAKLIELPEEQMRHPEAYIFRTAANLLNDRYRRLQVREAYRADVIRQAEEPADYIDPLRLLEARERLGLVGRALSGLSQRSREVLLLVRVERMPKRDIANTFGISISAVDKHLIRALAHITRCLEDQE